MTHLYTLKETFVFVEKTFISPQRHCYLEPLARYPSLFFSPFSLSDFFLPFRSFFL